MGDKALTIKKLVMQLEGFRLKDIDFDLPKGTILGLIGKNGAGKTTLIKSICGIYPLFSGNIYLNGFDLYHNERNYLSQIGVLPDYQWLNMFLKPKKIAKILRKSYYHFNEAFYLEKLEQFDIPKDKRLSRLSLGTQKKLSIIIIMSLNPNIVILDEPTANIDPVSKREIINMLQTYIEDEEKTIIYATHQTEELDRIADYVLCLDDGEIKFYDTKENLIEKHFIARLSQNELERIPEDQFISIKKNSFGYDGLTTNKSLIDKYELTFVKPNIEDLMYYYTSKERQNGLL